MIKNIIIKNNIVFFLYSIFFVSLSLPISNTYIETIFELTKVGELQTTETFVPLKESRFWDLKKIALFSFGSIALGTLGYAGYTEYQDSVKYNKARLWIKEYFKMSILEKIDLIDEEVVNNQYLLSEYRKIIQQKIKNKRSNKLLFLTIAGVISAVAGIMIYNYVDSSHSSSTYYHVPSCSSNNKINRENVSINSNNTNIINNNTTVINNKPSEDSININYVNKKNTIEESMELFAKKVLSIISKSRYFVLHHNTFLDYVDYFENDCSYVNSKNVESVLIEIILEIIAESLVVKHRNKYYTNIN
jgi:hypothetical protein